MSVRIYRATVRGFFDGLDDRARTVLLDRAAEHDGLAAAFTPDGTFVYGPELAAFSFRFELRVDDEDAGADAAGAVAEAVALERATTSLTEWGFGNKRLRVTGLTDMAGVWSDP